MRSVASMISGPIPSPWATVIGVLSAIESTFPVGNLYPLSIDRPAWSVRKSGGDRRRDPAEGLLVDTRKASDWAAPIHPL